MTSSRPDLPPSLRSGTPTIRFGGRSRLRGRLMGLGAVLVVGAVAAGLGLPASDGDDAVAGTRGGMDRIAGGARAAAVAPPAGAAHADQVELPPVFASVDRQPLYLPGEVLLVGFHEAALDGAMELLPHGDAIANENTTKVTTPRDDPAGPEYVVLSSRGRPRPGTSAVDLVMRDDEPVSSPVSGVVTDVADYYLYGKYADTRVEIRPDGRPDLRVVLIHLAGVTVTAGDEVTVATTPLAAGPNRFPFASHIDRYFPEDRWPHVHIEVKRPEAATAVDPDGR